MSWRNLIKHFLTIDGDIYEFGVYAGDSIISIVNEFHTVDKHIGSIFGFDSFEGIPEEKLDKNNREEWQVGFCDVRKKLGVTTPEEAARIVQHNLSTELKEKVCLIPGFWDSILTDGLIQRYNMGVASYIDIDCDIYSSAILALDFMFRNKLAVSGTLIGYDDWGGTMVEHDEYEAGESRAHLEIMRKYNVQCKKLIRIGRPPHVQTLWRIL